jgi:hypothetical protein
MRENTAITDNPTDLVDISEVKVDKNLPKQARITDYVRQLKDPYHYKYKHLTVTAKYTEDGPPLEDCLIRLMT